MELSRYNKKRDFNKTPEPFGKRSQGGSRLFIVQKHAASHLHYDFRLELNGVLKSWAIPKGPCLDPHVKRLAIHVEDHPLAYGSFEGVIPQGQYGGGTVMLWDKGTWKSLDEDAEEAYKKGHLRFELDAHKLKGRWDLIRFKEDKHWFLIKYQDENASLLENYDITQQNKSVKTEQSMEEIAENYQHIWTANGLKKAAKKTQSKNTPTAVLLPSGLKKSSFPDFIAPQLATLVNKPPEGNQWLHEIKFDGYRILAFKKDEVITLKSRNNKEWTETFDVIAQALRTIPAMNAVFDGEIVLLDEQGKSDFQLLQNSLKTDTNPPFIYYLFDLLHFEGYDLRALKLVGRKSILKECLSGAHPSLRYSDHIIKGGGKVFERSCELALEGIVSKRADSVYTSKRSQDWLKIKCLQRQEFVIGGYTAPKGERTGFGALLLGIFNEAQQLEYAGNVGTGFTEKSLQELYKKLQSHRIASHPFSTWPPASSKVQWVEPVLIAEVEFTEWTEEGHLRHPSFKGLRFDKQPSAITREQVTSIESIKNKKGKRKKENTFVISHPDKILYPEDGYTKQDLLTYYETVSDLILPHISERPLTLVRCPSNYHECFYQRHYNHKTEGALHSIEVPQDKSKEEYIYLNDKAGLFTLVQMGVLEIHPWGSRISHLEYPDRVIIDLDPAPDVDWKTVTAAAREMRTHLEQFQLQSFVKSTGGKGLHLVIPIHPEYRWEEVKTFTHVFVQFLEKLKPELYISKMTKSKRAGKIFVDYLRNQRTATAIGAFSPRARIHAPVSTPLAWEELSHHIEDNTYTIKTLPKRLQALKEDPWKDFWTIKQSLRLDEFKF